MTCTLCSVTIESSLERLKGVKKAQVSYATEKARLEYDNELVDFSRIQKTIESLGFYTDDGIGAAGGKSGAEAINAAGAKTQKSQSESSLTGENLKYVSSATSPSYRRF